jgi:polar amino acid transport system substrate-binding protein
LFRSPRAVLALAEEEHLVRAGCRLLSVVATIAALGGCVECARADTILVEDASGPFSRIDGTGYANDVVRAAFAAAGIDIAFDVVPYARCKESLIAGRTPACFSMSRSETLGDAVVFSAQPIFDVVATVYQRRAAPRHWISLADIPSNARVGIVNGYEYPEGVYELQRSGVIMDAARDEVVNLRRLARGRIEAAIIMTDRYERIDQRAIEAGVATEVMSSFNAGTLDSYIGFSTRHPDGERLRAKFDKGYQAIVRSGAKRAIDATWLTHVNP